MRKSLTVILLLILSIAQISAADTNTAKINIEAPFKPERAMVLIISDGQTIEKLDTSLSLVREGSYLVGFEYASGEVAPESRALAIVFSADGTSAMSRVQPLTPASALTAAEIPLCPEKRHQGQLLTSQYGLIKQLVEVREERLNNVRQRLAEKLQQGSGKRLAGLEQLFGIRYPAPIDPAADSLELIERVSRTVLAVRFYKSNRQPAES